tara:strand:- start:563 stop:979 length:417 start_codon:yes stop_codon:yes gene_type:complete
MSHQNNTDISNVQVPDSFIQEILNETQPLKEAREEVHPSRPQTQVIHEETAASEGGVAELLSLMFEEFDKLNSRLDSLQESLTEMTAVGSLGAPGGGMPACPSDKPSRKRRSSKAPARKVRTESTNALAALLAKRTGR